MPRQARLRLAGYPVHVIQRGNNRNACFRAEADYLVYLLLLKQHAEEFGCALHAYVLMTNHVHLLLTPREADGTSLMMKHQGQCYVQFFNRKYDRTGSLWEGRFRSSIVQEHRYLLACYRYIEFNPVRAGIVKHPRDYSWSSYSANAEGATSSVITPHPAYIALGGDGLRCIAYRALFQAPVVGQDLTEIRSATHGGYAIGDATFKARLAKRVGRSVEWRQPGRPCARS